MNPSDLPAEADFRAEVADWMARHLAGRFAPLRHRGGPGDETAHAALRREWEQEMAAGGWIGLGWPRAHGGRALPVALQVAFHEEYARAGGPGRIGHIGETLLAPTLIDFGTPEQQQRFLPGIREGKVVWCQGYSEPGAGSDLAAIRSGGDQLQVGDQAGGQMDGADLRTVAELERGGDSRTPPA